MDLELVRRGGGYAWLGHHCVEELIKKAKSSCDFLIIMVHAGAENWDFPLPEIRELYKKYIDWGADVIIGNHPHVAQGWEIYEDKWIFYSLGNFAFYEGEKARNHEHSLCVSVEIHDKRINCKPIYCRFFNGQTHLCEDLTFVSHMRKCNEILNNEEAYCKSVNEKILNNAGGIIEDYSQINGIYSVKTSKNIMKSIIKRYIWKKSFNTLWLYHNIMIETHYWVTKRWLNLKMEKNEL